MGASYSLFLDDVPLVPSKSLFASDPDAYRQKLVEYLAVPTDDTEEFAEGEAVGGDAT